MSDEPGGHYWVIITDAVDGAYVGVNITDEKNCPDSPCKLAVGCLPVVIKSSVIYYKKARRFPAADFAKLIATHAQTFAPCPDLILDRIIVAAFRADDLTASILDLIRKDGNDAP